MNEEGKVGTNQKAERTIGSAIIIAMLAISIALLFAGREAGIRMAYRDWENMLVASGLANPEIAAKVAVNCRERRDQFAVEAASRRKVWDAVSVLRDKQPVPQPQVAAENPKEQSTEKPNSEPKADVP